MIGSVEWIVVNFEKFTSIPITVGCLEGCDWLLHRFKEVNFSKLADSNQIFRNYFVYLHDHLCEISLEIIGCIIFASL